MPVLTWLLLVAACTPSPQHSAGASPQHMPPRAMVAPAREQTADQQVAHVLSRLTFGARPGDVARVRAMGVDAFIARQLRPDRIEDARLDPWLKQFETLHLPYAKLQEAYPRPESRKIITELQVARVGRALITERQLDEVMTDFWLNHFSVFAGKGARERYLLAEFENRVIRPRAMGRFRDLLGAVAKSPAMLFYLDNWQSAADSGRPRLRQARIPAARTRGLNENYGRELLELHTLGVDGGYTQQDVISVARALTGWTFLPARPPQRAARRIAQRLPDVGEFYFNPAVHDAGEKVVLGVRLRAGRSVEDGEQVLDIVATHPATARHIATKLARRFVSDEPPEELIDRAAETFTRTNGDIREVLRTIITSDAFFSDAAFRAKVKTPVEVVVSALRALDAAPDPTPRTSQIVANLGQPIYGRQTPDGWPDVASEWMGTGAILARINFGLTVGVNRVPGAHPTGWPGADALAAAERTAQVDGVIAAFLGGRVSPETREILINGRNPLASGASTGTEPPMPPLRGLAQLVGLAIGSPEFQRR